MQLERVEADAVRPLRQRVLRPHQDPDELVFPGDDAQETMHAAVRERGVVVGVATVVREPWRQDPDEADWRIRGMAVSADRRGCGIGSMLLASCEAHARTNAGMRLWCNARIGARGFYERAGFAVDGDVFVIPAIGEHVLMTKLLTRGAVESSDTLGGAASRSRASSRPLA